MAAVLCRSRSIRTLAVVATVACQLVHGQSVGSSDNTKELHSKGLVLCKDIFPLADQCKSGEVTGPRCEGIEAKVEDCLNGDRRLDDSHDSAESVHSKGGLVLCKDIFLLANQCKSGEVTGPRCEGIEAKVEDCLNGDRRLDDTHDSAESVHSKGLVLCKDIFRLADQCQTGNAANPNCEGIEAKVKFCLNGDRRLQDTHVNTESVRGQLRGSLPKMASKKGNGDQPEMIGKDVIV